MQCCSALACGVLVGCWSSWSDDSAGGAKDTGEEVGTTDTGDSEAGGTDTDTGEAPLDTQAPVIEYTPDGATATVGAELVVEATITDSGTGVAGALLYYRQETAGGWSSTSFVTGVGPDRWTSAIPAEDVGSAGIWYYLQAADEAGNTALAPASGEADPFHVIVQE